MCLLSGNHRHWQTFSEVGCGWSPVLQSLAREQECRLMSGSTAWGTRGSMPWLRLEMDPAKPAGIHTTMHAHMFIRLPLYIMIIILPKNFLKLQYSVRWPLYSKKSMYQASFQVNSLSNPRDLCGCWLFLFILCQTMTQWALLQQGSQGFSVWLLCHLAYHNIFFQFPFLKSNFLTATLTLTPFLMRLQ